MMSILIPGLYLLPEQMLSLALSGKITLQKKYFEPGAGPLKLPGSMGKIAESVEKIPQL